MNGVLDQDGLGLGLQLSGPAQHPHGVAAGILRRALPGIDAHQHSVILGGMEDPVGSRVRASAESLLTGRTCRASACCVLMRIFGMRRSQGTVSTCLELLLWDCVPSLGGKVTT